MRAARLVGVGGVTISGHGPAILALTTDALFNVRKPPSEGFALTQQENVGKIENKGRQNRRISLPLVD